MLLTPSREVLRRLGVLRTGPDGERLELTTSGTSAAPRTVVRTLSSWEDSYDHVTSLTGVQPSDRVLVPAPATSSMFAFALAHSAHVGAAVVHLDRWSLRHAQDALQDCTVAHLTPPMLAGLVGHDLGHDLGRLRVVICAGASLPPGVRSATQQAGVEVVDYYGAAELSFVAIRIGEQFAAFPEVEISVRDGVVWARSPWLSQGYAADQSGPFRRDDSGWATVGDRGAWDDEAGLVLTGRGDDVVTTGGATVLCGDVEMALLSLPSVGAVAVVGTPHHELGERLEAVVVPASAPFDLDDVRRQGAALVARTHLPRRWHVWDALPLTAAGKVDRSAVRARIARERQALPS